MTVMLDARGLGRHISGIDRYVLGVLSGITEIQPPTPVTVLVRQRKALKSFGAGGESLRFVDCAIPPWSIRNQVVLPRLLRRLGCKVYHCPYVMAPLRCRGVSCVITVHDLIPTVCREGINRSWKARLGPIWNRWFRAQCRAADSIITVSDWTRRVLLETINISEHRVHRIYNGVDHERPQAPVIDVRSRFNLSGRIILYVGRHDPYKNIAALVQAFARILDRSREPCTLVIAGKLDRRYPEARLVAQSMGIADRVVFTDYIDEDTRRSLLAEASVFAFPSRYEGFGLPPLEAMVAGVPVVASNATSLPEVLGDAALLVNPNDSNALADAIVSVLRDPLLAVSLCEKGRAKAARFTWRQCAAEHIRLYQQLLERHPAYTTTPTERLPAGSPLLKNPIT